MDTPTLHAARGVCDVWGSEGEEVWRGRSPYFKLIHSSPHYKREIRYHNIKRLKWLTNILANGDDANAWIIRRIEIPLREAVECPQVGELLAVRSIEINDVNILSVCLSER